MTAGAGVGSLAGATPIRHVEACMGTVFSFELRAPGVPLAELDRALAWLHDMDALFSTYRPDSQVSAIAAGRLRVADARAEVREVLAACAALGPVTDGYFTAHPRGRLDPSGYVKGWAAQTVSDRLRAAGSANHCVNAGGDVVCAGRPEPGRGWHVGVSDPLVPGRLLRTVVACGPVAVATSGPAERGAHIVDPHTGAAARGLAGVTVVARDLVTADVYATAAVAMGPQRGPRWLAGRPEIRAIAVRADGSVDEVGWPAQAAGVASGAGG